MLFNASEEGKKKGSERKHMASEKTKVVLYGFTVASIVILMTGCFDKSSLLSEDANGNAQTSNLSVQQSASPVSTGKGQSKKKDLEISSPSEKDHASSEKGKDDPATSEDKGTKKELKTDKNKPSKSVVNKQKYDVSDPFTASKPTLMGLTTADNIDAVLHKFGNPANQFVMEDPTAPVTVYEYPGFSVGLGKANTIVFIEVNSDQVNPGLNGFRLGQKVSQAIKALGNPDVNSEYVVSYKSGGVILKLDVDPNSNIVRSIKLFNEE